MFNELMQDKRSRSAPSASAGRYFYEDPLAAAWMAKHFGMKLFVQQHRWIKGKDGKDFVFGSVGLCHEIINENKCNGRHERYYVHPDSLHMLEPRVGDLVWYRMMDCTHIGEPPMRVSTLSYEKPVGVNRREYYPQLEWIDRVIERDGIAFMWPEVQHKGNDS